TCVLLATAPLSRHCFFQAEDGIRDFHVTGVQTCALPISLVHRLDLRISIRTAFNISFERFAQRLQLRDMLLSTGKFMRDVILYGLEFKTLFKHPDIDKASC